MNLEDLDQPPIDPVSALARIREAAESAEDDLVPVAVAAEIRAMAEVGMDDETVLAVRVYLTRERKHLGVGPRDLERIVKQAAVEAFRQEQARRAKDNTRACLPAAGAAHLHTPPSWASDLDILKRMVGVLRVCMGLVGEHRSAKLVYLAITSRLLDEPVNIAVKGLSSSGKSYTIECVARLFPEEAVYTMTAMSERALIYLDEPLARRTIILYEAVALREGREKAEDNQTAYIVRSLLSEGRIEYPVVMRDEETGRLRTEKLIIDGPTNLVTSTTSVSLHGENETRMISLPSNDSKAQTRAVMIESSDEKKRQGADLGEWHAFQRWLAAGPLEVVIPYARCVAAQIPPVAVRLRRDWNAIRSLIKAHAILHRASRETGEDGRIIAELADYAAVRSLVNDLIAEAVGSTVPQSVRETVELVQSLTVKADPVDEPPDPDGVKVAKVAALLKLERSAATRRLHTARDRGYLINLEEGKKGTPAMYVLGDPMPDEVVVLPKLGDICTPPCTHVPQDETPGPECDCTGVCRCADDAAPIETGNILDAGFTDCGQDTAA